MEDCHVSEKAASMPGDRPQARKFTIKGRIRSFRCALAGLMLMLKTQHNAWLHAVASIGVLSAGALFGLSEAEWCVLVLAIAVVWTAEALNTALELLADAASPEFHPLVAKAKDVAAAAVLISAVGSAVIGLLVLGPQLYMFVAAVLTGG